MRISDWSSDVCASDLERRRRRFGIPGFQRISQLVACAVKTDDVGDVLNAALASASGDVDHDVDRLGDPGAWRVHRAFQNQLPKEQERRSEERRDGKEGVSKCRMRRERYNKKKK